MGNQATGSAVVPLVALMPTNNPENPWAAVQLPSTIHTVQTSHGSAMLAEGGAQKFQIASETRVHSKQPGDLQGRF